jgi:predicted CoA-binding protein
MEPLFGSEGQPVAFLLGNDRLVSAEGAAICWIDNDVVIDYRGTVRGRWDGDHLRGVDGRVMACMRISAWFPARRSDARLCTPTIMGDEPARLPAFDGAPAAPPLPEWGPFLLRPPVDHDRYPDRYLRGILEAAKTVAVVGASPDPARASHRIAAYLIEQGYDVIPVNPDAAGHILFGKTVVRSLAEADRAIDLVDVFRRPAAVPAVVREVVPLRIPFLWMQLGVRHDAACSAAEQAGVDVVMDRCMKREHIRLVASIRDRQTG